jgi:CheY-like chemotaxis protein
MRRILVVDDDRHTRLAIGIWLKQCGFRVAITDGGESGLTALNDGTFDLMMVDVFMPNMRGFESIRVFHSHAPTVQVDRDLRLRFFRLGNGRSRLLQDGMAGDAARRDR